MSDNDLVISFIKATNRVMKLHSTDQVMEVGPDLSEEIDEILNIVLIDLLEKLPSG